MPRPGVNEDGEFAQAEFRARQLIDEAKEKGFKFIDSSVWKDKSKENRDMYDSRLFLTTDEGNKFFAIPFDNDEVYKVLTKMCQEALSSGVLMSEVQDDGSVKSVKKNNPVRIKDTFKFY